MKKIILTVTALLTFYIAVMYQYTPLMILAAAELIIIPVMLVTAQILKRRLTVGFTDINKSAVKLVSHNCCVTVKNSGKLPIGKLHIKLKYGYSNSLKSDKTSKIIYGSAAGNSKQTLCFTITAPYCGLLTVKTEQTEVYDYISLFSAKKKSDCQMHIAVFPQEKYMNIQILSSLYERIGTIESYSNSADDNPEIKQIREYQNGDSARLIHINQTAKTDKLWIKELEKEKESIAHVTLDVSELHNSEPKEADAFYEILSALVLGILRIIPIVKVYCNGSENIIRNGNELRELLLTLYKAVENDSINKKHFSESTEITLNSSLELLYRDNLIYKFSVDNYINEIAGVKYTIN